MSGFSTGPLLALGPRRVWAASCSLCTGAVLVVAGSGNHLQTCSPSGRKPMGTEKVLCALAPAPHPSPAREGPTKGPLQKWQKTSFWKLHSRKLNSPRETKLSPNACLLRKTALSGFSPSPVFGLGPRRVWAASHSLCNGAMLVFARAVNQIQTCSRSGRRPMGPENAFCALAPAPHNSPARDGAS